MDMLFIITLMTSVISVYCTSPLYYGSGWNEEECGSDHVHGPHSTECLISLWTDAGCYHSGTASPSDLDRAQMQWWNERSVRAVRADMELYYEYAMNGDESYRTKCFGDTICSYQQFEGHALYGLNDETLSGSTPEACATKCDQMGPNCNSFDYNTQTKTCLLSSANRETAPDAYGPHANIVYYEKACGSEVQNLWTDGDDKGGIIPGVMSYQDGHCYVKYGPIGGGGGVRWDDKDIYQSTHENITKIAIRHASLIDAIQLTYGQTTTARHGGSGGASFELSLESGEYVTGVKGKTSSYWNTMTITTNKNTVGPFGARSSGEVFQVETGGKSLAYISGQSGDLVDQLTFYFNC